MDAFIGTIDAKTDSKGRVFVPAVFRKILQSSGESRLILRKDIYQDCLVLYAEQVWKEELDKLREQLNEWNEEEQHTYRMISSFVERLELDSSGRILIPKKYLLKTNITHTVCFIGMNKTIEIWSPDQLEKAMLSAEDMKSQVKKFLGGSKRPSEKSGQE